MGIPKTDIIQQLRREIIALDGLRHVPMDDAPQEGLSLFAEHFPHGRFPLGTVHELKPFSGSDQSAALGFSLALMQTALPVEGIIAWISAQPMPLYAPGLKQLGIDPARIMFIQARKPADRQWAMEEALQCKPLAAVVGEVDRLDFKQSRRLQLAAEKTGVTALVLPSGKSTQSNASTSRWLVRSLPSHPKDDLPGIGDPQWQIDLLHMRHGKPGSWAIRWSEGRFQVGADPLAGAGILNDAVQREAFGFRKAAGFQPVDLIRQERQLHAVQDATALINARPLHISPADALHPLTAAAYAQGDVQPPRIGPGEALQPFPAAHLLEGYFIHEKRVYA